MAAAGPAGTRPSALTLWGIAVAACAMAAVSTVLALTSDHVSEPGWPAVLGDWVVLGYGLAGVVAWWRRPESRFGPLLLAAASVFFVSSLARSDAALPYTIGIAFDLLPAAVFLHVFLAYPSGRLERRFERVLVAASYLVAFPVHVAAMTLGGFGPDNLLALTTAQDASTWVLRVQLGALSAFLVAGVLLLAVRRRRSPAAPRRALALLIDSFALGLLMLAFLFVAGALGMIEGQAAFEWLRRAMFFVIGLAPLAFLAGLLQARLARSAVGDLFIELRSNPAPGDLRDALARALGDPSLALLYWLPQFESWADLEGRQTQLPAENATRATTLLDRDGEHVAALVHHPVLEDEPELLQAVAAAAAIALENARLHAELQARLTELQGSRARIVAAGDSERRRLERNLHDGAQQRLVGIALQLRLLQDRIRGGNPDEAEQLVTTVSDELARSLSELRELARGIHPAVLEHGLSAALDSLAARSAVTTTVTFEPIERLPEPVEFAAYFVASEALANVAKYAHATVATVRVWRTDGVATIEIADNGIGGADASSGSGLRGLADRVEALEGRLLVSSPPGGGTVVMAEMPCGS
jgi:signal transduction histidine kinase